MRPSVFMTAVLLCAVFAPLPAAGGGPAAQNLLPRVQDVAGWQPAGKPHRYTPDNLYHYINGSADLFNSYGFVELAGGEYSAVADGRQNVTVDIYCMKNKLNAFGIYQAKRDPDSPSLTIGAGAFGGDQYLFFYKDRFYIEIQAYVSGQSGKEVMMGMARGIEKKIPGDGKPPAQLGYLPARGLVPGSRRYITGGILGHAFLDKGLMGNYRAERDVVTAFVAFFASSGDAAAALSSYKDFLQKAGKMQQDLKGFGETGFVSEEPYHKKLMVARRGSFVVGVTDVDDVQLAKKVLQPIISGLKKESK